MGLAGGFWRCFCGGERDGVAKLTLVEQSSRMCMHGGAVLVAPGADGGAELRRGFRRDGLGYGVRALAVQETSDASEGHMLSIMIRWR
eukprot:15472634-Alexandrium_andersonii.AAC.1